MNNNLALQGFADPPGVNLGDTRASDADRQRVAQHLDTQHGAGRLSVEEHDARIKAVMTARTLPELAQLYSDLPAIVPPGARVRKPLTVKSTHSLQLLTLSVLGGVVTMIVPGSVLISTHQAHVPWWVSAGGWLSLCVGLVWTIVNIVWAIAIFDS